MHASNSWFGVPVWRKMRSATNYSPSNRPLMEAFERRILMTGLPSYKLGDIPSLIYANGQIVDFIVTPTAGQTASLTIQANPQPLGAISLDGSTGEFRYAPAP